MSFESSAAEPAIPAAGPVASAHLLSCLQESQGRLWVIRPSGNFGDDLLFLGLETLLRRTGLKFELARHDQLNNIAFNVDDVAYIHGGGGWVPLWSGTPARVLRTLVDRHRGRIIVGPSSFSTDQAYLETALVESLRVAPGRVTVFCRERPSHEALVSAAGHLADIVLEHDTALNLTRQEVMAFGEPVGPNRGYRLFALRGDAESRPVGACRVLRVPVDPIGYCYSFKHWVRLHARAGSIVTNRLHSAICGSILGVPTTLLPNSYHKARGVWEHSLAARGVQWIDRLPPDWMGELEEGVGITRYWQRTPKLQRLIGRLRFGSSR